MVSTCTTAVYMTTCDFFFISCCWPHNARVSGVVYNHHVGLRSSKFSADMGEEILADNNYEQ